MLQSGSLIKKPDHDFGEWTQTKAPTCTQPGEETRACKREGCEEKQTHSVDALEHDFGEWTQTKAPTCTQTGEETRACKREGCEEEETREVGMIAHNYVEPIEPEYFEETITENGVDYVVWGHYKVCEMCKEAKLAVEEGRKEMEPIVAPES